MRETFLLARRSLRRFELAGPRPRTQGEPPREPELHAAAALGVPGAALALPFSLAGEGRGDSGGGGNPGSPLPAASPSASAQASSAPRTEPGPALSGGTFSLLPLQTLGVHQAPQEEREEDRTPPQPRSVWTALGASRKGAGQGGGLGGPVCPPGAPQAPRPRPPPPPRICSVAGGMEMSVCCCLTHPDLIDFFSADKRPLMSSFSSY